MLLGSRIQHGSELSDMRYRTLAAALAVLFSVAPSRAQTRVITLPLDSTEGLKPINAKIESVTHKDRKALRVTDSAPEGTSDDGRLVVVTGSQFEDGLIEVDVAGDRIAGATEAARGFVGVAFRVAPDGPSFEAFYLRPYNGRSNDQLQRNHSAQYISSPEYPWNRLRQEFPGKYEAYVDLVPGEWTKMKIEVKGDKARLYVNGAPEPTLIVNHLLHSGEKGAVALFISVGSVAHFANLRVAK
jgi:3-keto-disaccharide hydrolase